MKRAVLACACLGLVCAAIYCWTGFQARRIMKQAEAKWVAIGRPMPAFVASLKPVEENAKFSEFQEAVGQFGFATLYKPKDQTGIPGGSKQPPWDEIVSYLSSIKAADGDAAFTAKAPGYIAESTAELDQLYAVLKNGEFPKWGYDPREAFKVQVPSFLAIRQLAQLGEADAFHRISKGDLAGAEMAIAASLRAGEDLAHQPTLVSLMIRIAVESLLAEASAYLPEDPDAFAKIGKEAQRLRAQFINVIQFEAYSFNQGRPEDFEWLPDQTPQKKLPMAWNKLTHRFDIWRARNSLYCASICEIAGKLENHLQEDLGAADLDGRLNPNDGIMAPSFVRALARLNCTLVKLEQASMIRSARAALQAGKTRVTQESAVIPGATWEAAIDVKNQSVALSLHPIPEWISKKDVADDSFYLTPVDGSKSWKFNGKALASQPRNEEPAQIQPVQFAPAE